MRILPVLSSCSTRCRGAGRGRCCGCRPGSCISRLHLLKVEYWKAYGDVVEVVVVGGFSIQAHSVLTKLSASATILDHTLAVPPLGFDIELVEVDLEVVVVRFEVVVVVFDHVFAGVVVVVFEEDFVVVLT
jgi:hypothetical protein